MALPRRRDQDGGVGVPRGDARRNEARERARRDCGARQGRLARCAVVLAAPGRARADAPRLAVAPAREGGRARRPRDPQRARRRNAAARLSEGVHGRDARVADGADARRHRRRDHERRGARAHHRPRRPRGLSGRRARDRRQGEPRRARRVRTHARAVAGCGSPEPHRARPVRHVRGSPALCRARRRRVGAVLACTVRSRPRRPLLGRQDRPGVPLPLARRLRRGRRERQRRADRGARPAGGHSRGRTADDRRARRLAAGRGRDASSRRCTRPASRRPGSRATNAAAASSSPAISPISSSSTATRTRISTHRSSRRWSPGGGCTTRRPGTELAGDGGTSRFPRTPPPVRCADRRLRRRVHNPPPWD